MTERNPDAAIKCDICDKHSGFNDPREPWECWWDGSGHMRKPKPTWRCEMCKKAVADATEQRKYLKSLK